MCLKNVLSCFIHAKCTTSTIIEQQFRLAIPKKWVSLLFCFIRYFKIYAVLGLFWSLRAAFCQCSQHPLISYIKIDHNLTSLSGGWSEASPPWSLTRASCCLAALTACCRGGPPPATSAAEHNSARTRAWNYIVLMRMRVWENKDWSKLKYVNRWKVDKLQNC